MINIVEQMKIKLFATLVEAEEKVPLGKVAKLIIKDKPYALVHSPNGFYGTAYKCPHRNEPLTKGHINAFNELICPLHEYRFNLTTGQEASHRCHHLTLYQISVHEDGLYINI